MKALLKYICAGLVLGVTLLQTSCSEEWLETRPLSFFTPENVLIDEAGYRSMLIALRKKLKHDTYHAHNESDLVPLCGAQYQSTDVAVTAQTGANAIKNLAEKLSPTNYGKAAYNDLWDSAYGFIKTANVIISRIDDISWDNEESRKEVLSEAYFHRSYWYLRLVNFHGDVPFSGEEVTTAKLDFNTHSMWVVLDKLTKDMEYAVGNLPDNSAATAPGVPNQAAGYMLLSKICLSNCQFEKAVEYSSKVIDNPKFALMRDRFGCDVDDPARNVMWDLFRWENINNQLNNETILATVDRYEDEMSRSWGCYKLRSFSPQLTHVSVVDSEGKVAVIGTGAGIDTIMIGNGDARPVEYMIKDIWNIHGETWDNTSDYRRADANWIDEHELIVNNPSSVDFGKPIQKEWFGNGATYQYYFGYPYYKTYYPMQDEARTAALKGYGGCGDSYLYRLAEAYLIRAEAYYWLDQIGNALSDVNVIRERANAALATASDITIDYIMDERARELFSEEMRTCEISRVALIMAKEGKEGYSMESLGTSNWYYDRMTKVNNQYRDQVVYLGETYKVSPHNVLMPVPAEAITANTLGRINQNYGYDGYGQNVPALTEPLSDPVE